jgi:hypothetical protein
MPTSASQHAWVITWREPAIDGYTDYFPLGAFGAPTARMRHLVVGPKGSRGFAACSVTISGNVVTLDYGAFSKENHEAGMDVGVLALTFDEKRRSLLSARWNGKKAMADISIGLAPSLPAYQPKSGKLRRVATVSARGSQGKFRAAVRAAYGDRCAISGCDISEALEAAHIDPYENPSQHHPGNGLLLRRDLHALFDRGLIGIEPESSGSHVVHFHPSLHRFPEYKALHGKPLRAPEDGFAYYAPAEKAVARKWKVWQSDTAV